MRNYTTTSPRMAASATTTTSIDKDLPICVTGGSGFLASWVVKGLIDRGFSRVHATTRRMEKALFLRNIDGVTTDNLKLFEGCDFAIPNSFDEAIQGCYGVIHCASPFFNGPNANRENLVTPAVDGTEMVLKACSEYDVKRVVLTSSTAAVVADYGTKATGEKNHVYTDEDFSPADILEEHQNYYCLSKLYAEQRAWELSQEDGCPYQLSVMNPGLILGPMTKGQTHLNTSSASILQYMDGTHDKIQNGYRTIVDVRDVADAHIVPIEQDIGWNRRYILIGGAPHFKETAGYVKRALEQRGMPSDKVPTEVNSEYEPTMMGPPANLPLLYDNTPAQTELGIQFRSDEEMITTSVNEMLDNGFTGSHQYDTNKL